jgi:hypothetical protein
MTLLLLILWTHPLVTVISTLPQPRLTFASFSPHSYLNLASPSTSPQLTLMSPSGHPHLSLLLLWAHPSHILVSTSPHSCLTLTLTSPHPRLPSPHPLVILSSPSCYPHLGLLLSGGLATPGAPRPNFLWGPYTGGRNGVSKGIEYGHRPPTLRADHP